MSRIIVPRRDLILPNRHKQRGFILNPYRFASGGGSIDHAALLAKITRWFSLDSSYKDEISDLTAVGNAYSGVAAKVGNGANQPHFQLGRHSAPVFDARSEKCSFGCWVKVSNFTNSTVLMAIYEDTGSGEAVAIATETSGRFKAYCRDAAGTQYVVQDSSGARSIDAFYLVGVDYDNGTATLRVNASEIGSVNLGGSGIRAPQKIGVGNFFSGIGFPGVVDSAFFADKGDQCLTGAEWAYIFNAGSGVSFSDIVTAAGVAVNTKRRWRILVSAVDGGSSCSLAGLEFRATAGGPSVTGGGMAFASSYYQNNATYGPEKAFDGSDTSIWAAYDEVACHLGYHLSMPTTINQVMIRARPDGGTYGQTPKDFKVQSSADGVAWADEWTVSGSSGWSGGEARVFTRP